MKKIQIIEDDAALRRELRILLEGQGYAVEETEDYENLAAEIMKSEADLILLASICRASTGKSF